MQYQNKISNSLMFREQALNSRKSIFCKHLYCVGLQQKDSLIDLCSNYINWLLQIFKRQENCQLISLTIHVSCKNHAKFFIFVVKLKSFVLIYRTSLISVNSNNLRQQLVSKIQLTY